MKKIPNCVFAAFLLLVFMGATLAAALDCKNLDAGACKAEFGVQFDKDVKAMYAGVMKRILSRFVEIYGAFTRELPPGDKLIGPFNKKIEEFNKKIQLLEQNELVIDDLIAVILERFDYFEPDFKNSDLEKESKKFYDEKFKKHNRKLSDIKELFAEEDRFIYDRSYDIWLGLYSLRPSILNGDHELLELDNVYKGLKMSDADWKSMVYWSTVENTIKVFDMKFLKAYTAAVYRAINSND